MRAKSLTSASRVGVRYIESFLLLGSSDLRGLPECREIEAEPPCRCLWRQRLACQHEGKNP